MPVAAKEHVDALADRLSDVNPGVREFCRDALIVAGDVAKPALQRVLDNPEPLIRLQAAAALVAIDPAHGQAKNVIAQGVVAVGNADIAAFAKEIAIKSGTPVVGALLHAIATVDADQRIATIAVLGKMRSHAKEAETKLFDMMRADADASVRQAAMQALLGIASAESLRPVLQDLIKDPNEDVASHAAVMLRRLGGI
jgi:HEAT repeat protein